MKSAFLLIVFLLITAPLSAQEASKDATNQPQDAVAEKLKKSDQVKPVAVPSISLFTPVDINTVPDPLEGVYIAKAIESARKGNDGADQQIEKVLQKLGSRNPASRRVLYLSLSQWYEARRQYVQAAKAQEAWLDIELPPDDYANATLAAARLYWKAGMHEEAETLYTRVPTYGYGWATGMALYDEATIAMEDNNPQRAQELLVNALQQKAVTGLYADQIQTTLYTTLAFAQYRQGKLKEARHSANKSQKLYKSLKFVLPNEGIEEQYNLAGEMKQWITRWKKSPFFVESTKVTVPVPKSTFDQNAGKGVVYFSVYLHSQNEIHLEIKTSDHNVVQSTQQSKTVKGTFGVIHEIALQATLSENDLPLHTLVTISSSQAKGKTAKIEVELVPESLVITQ